MFETLKRLYLEGRLADEKLSNAVTKGWITEDEKQQIINAKNATVADSTNIAS
ncbi:XkdX family protein [Clostridium sp. 19966]|uniref:XkdX family protein n=1 Tax=Clostridium sp. 19966 TaxID=2768166 RepID=UPI0028E08E4C|nr:XkdX family protein [Clostridium sp. 19966]MDT8717745.1 XkdX family protein [Clostridium sp. 19966]